MTQDAISNCAFHESTDHNLNVPAGTLVLSAWIGRIRAHIWLNLSPRQIWSEDRRTLIGELDHPVWRISAGHGSVAASEKVAKYRAEAIAREVSGMPLEVACFTNQASTAELAEDARILGHQNAEAIRLAQSPGDKRPARSVF
ncbi:MAG: hypothetical protein ABJN42_03700 [Roseibium sp.]|uniref:hypothetical protein n=1 Tax=Roseibium sp. TaxID=1936156 RepID=UPI0032995CA9